MGMRESVEMLEHLLLLMEFQHIAIARVVKVLDCKLHTIKADVVFDLPASIGWKMVISGSLLTLVNSC